MNGRMGHVVPAHSARVFFRSGPSSALLLPPDLTRLRVHASEGNHRDIRLALELSLGKQLK
eukprot:1503931-Pyramimonas_sp.AAC.1